jgi:hypothetical protein
VKKKNDICINNNNKTLFKQHKNIKIMTFEIENTEKRNLHLINIIVNYCISREVQTLDNVQLMLERINPTQYIWGRSGSHIWLSQEDGKRIIIFK